MWVLRAHALVEEPEQHGLTEEGLEQDVRRRGHEDAGGGAQRMSGAGRAGVVDEG